MISARVIPCLLLKGSGLVKTTRFANPKYLGDPRNTVRIFNEKEADELMLLDILATPTGRGPQLGLIRDIVSEAFMPVAYGGGISTVEQAQRVLELGVEKVVISTAAFANPDLVARVADVVGSQSVVVCIDVRRKMLGRCSVYTECGRRSIGLDPVDAARQATRLGAGEIVINSIDRDGTMAGYDLELIKAVSDVVDVPVIACGGAGTPVHLSEAIRRGGASAVAAGSMFVFQGRHRAVLISYLDRAVLTQLVKSF
jgi:imidazole glycerol-phosphate synthase subunit HisF